jgi:DNA replication protein DnaC
MEKIRVKKENYDKDLEDYKNEIYNKISSDKEFYASLIRHGFCDAEILSHLSTFNDYYNNYLIKKQIKTYADCVRLNCFNAMFLTKDENKDIVRTFEPFAPVKEKIDYNSCFITKDFDDEFDNLKWSDIKNANIKKNISSLIKNNKWIYLSGATRCGKSYIAIALLNNFISKNHKKVAFINATTRFKELMDLYSSYNKDDKEEFFKEFDLYCNCDLLVIDDFGNEYKNEGIRDNVVIPLIKNRVSKNKLTIFTSEFSIDDVCTLYSINKQVGEIKSKQLKNILRSKIDAELLISSVPGLY